MEQERRKLECQEQERLSGGNVVEQKTREEMVAEHNRLLAEREAEMSRREKEWKEKQEREREERERLERERRERERLERERAQVDTKVTNVASLIHKHSVLFWFRQYLFWDSWETIQALYKSLFLWP